MTQQKNPVIYDYDIIIVGGGPAGLSAALRARWLRTYKALPASVAIIDPAGKGGLANWKDVLLTGPSFKLDIDEIIRDFSDFPVDFIAQPVIAASLTETFKVLSTPTATLTCRAVILCTGLKTLCNERDFLGKGLVLTLKDHRFMAQRFRELCSQNAGKRIVIWGSPRVLKLLNFFHQINRGQMNVTTVMEPATSDCFEPLSPTAGSGEIIEGRIQSIEGTGPQNHITSVQVEGPNRQSLNLPTDFLLLDFESYMQCTNSADIFEEVPKENGFIPVGHQLSTLIPNVYAAGDITGPPFCAAKAIGEGVKAGFNAYIKTYKDKFSVTPSLYAFYPDTGDRIDLEHTGFNLPELQDHYCPKLLMNYEDLSTRHQFTPNQEKLLRSMDGKRSIQALLNAGIPGITVKSLGDLIQEIINMKALTIHA